MTLTRARRLPLLLLALLLAACGDDPVGSHPGTAEGDLVFIPVDRDAPPLETTLVRFTAVKGEEKVVQIRYLYDDGTYGKCLLFRVPADALLRRPDGTAIRDGETVAITIEVEDPRRYAFRFAPSGLAFDPAAPAEIEISHRYASRDYDGDGDVDARDAEIFAGMRIWRQERPGAPWTELPTERPADFEARARIDGFTRYALAAD